MSCIVFNWLIAYDPSQVVISPKNYFLFTPLLPSVAVGTLNPRSIIQPTRYITRHKTRTVSVIEAEATDVDVSSMYDDVTANAPNGLPPARE